MARASVNLALPKSLDFLLPVGERYVGGFGQIYKQGSSIITKGKVRKLVKKVRSLLQKYVFLAHACEVKI
jgi:hypothetical protein